MQRNDVFTFQKYKLYQNIIALSFFQDDARNSLTLPISSFLNTATLLRSSFFESFSSWLWYIIFYKEKNTDAQSNISVLMILGLSVTGYMAALSTWDVVYG